MSNDKFKISRVNGSLFLENNEKEIMTISQTVDNDIWFSTSRDELTLELRLGSRTYSEWQTYLIFSSLMKALVGRYMLDGDNKKENSRLPKDFIDLDNNTITWHSDSKTKNVLKLIYDNRNDTIKISMKKSKDKDSYLSTVVRIRTDGSDYEYYYQEFLDFFKRLNDLELRLNKPEENIEPEVKEGPKEKKLSLFQRFRRG